MMDSLVAMFESPTQWMLVLVVVLVLFGGSKIPELMKGIGSGMREFKKGLNEEEKEQGKQASDAKGPESK